MSIQGGREWGYHEREGEDDRDEEESRQINSAIVDTNTLLFPYQQTPNPFFFLSTHPIIPLIQHPLTLSLPSSLFPPPCQSHPCTTAQRQR